jgi:PIN domain nuclease of toxin-antitoxin system
LLEDRTRRWFLSAISLAEALLLAARGRLDIDEPFERSLEEMVASSGVIELPLTFDAVLTSRSIDIPTRDPSDRLIGATAKCNALTLVAADRAFRRARGFDVRWFRARGHR